VCGQDPLGPAHRFYRIARGNSTVTQPPKPPDSAGRCWEAGLAPGDLLDLKTTRSRPSRLVTSWAPDRSSRIIQAAQP
jgi:hypothetical protein